MSRNPDQPNPNRQQLTEIAEILGIPEEEYTGMPQKKLQRFVSGRVACVGPGRPALDDPVKTIAFGVPLSVFKRIRVYTKRNRTTLSNLMRPLVLGLLDEIEAEEQDVA